VRLTVTIARRPARRRVTALLAACCALAMLGSALHHLLARHAVCAEHGETIDAPAARELARPPVSAQVEARAPAASQGQHEHCAWVHHRRSLGLGAPTLSVAAPPLVPAASVAFAARPAPAPRESVLSLAPKSSPPAG
jgi:hypothetical protein